MGKYIGGIVGCRDSSWTGDLCHFIIAKEVAVDIRGVYGKMCD
jgi:hypothetical protein